MRRRLAAAKVSSSSAEVRVVYLQGAAVGAEREQRSGRGRYSIQHRLLGVEATSNTSRNGCACLPPPPARPPTPAWQQGSPQEELAARLEGDGSGVAALQGGGGILQLLLQAHHCLRGAALDDGGERLNGGHRNCHVAGAGQGLVEFPDHEVGVGGAALRHRQAHCRTARGEGAAQGASCGSYSSGGSGGGGGGSSGCHPAGRLRAFWPAAGSHSDEALVFGDSINPVGCLMVAMGAQVSLGQPLVPAQ